ncbi:MAG: restriction endonuclease subunit S [Candidatus Methanomethylophilaceae archaeon]|jgi:type I restriction enzyme S subunit|nr:restriction endonuclease subunit S [Candidatus Methanomethylophilaceae archaeon]
MSNTSKTLNDVCEFIVDCLHATAPTQEDGYPLIRTPNIGKGRLILDGVYRVSEDTYKEWTRRAVPEANDLVLAREAPAGNVAIIKNGQQVCLGQRTVHLRPNPNQVDPDFLCYFLLTPQQQGLLLAGETGATAKHVNMKDIRRLPLKNLPGIEVQQRMGVILSTYDDLIENNRRRIALLEEAARLLYREWFVHLRFPGHEHVAIKDGVPEGWERMFLPDVIDVNPKTPIEKGREVWYVPMAALSETGMTADIGSFERRTKHTNVKFKRHDVLLARITPCLENGKTGFVYFLQDDEVACGSTEFIVLRGNRVSAYFAYCLARSYPFRENAIKSMIGSSGRQRVQVSCFDEYGVPLPPKHLLDMFDEIASKNFEQIRVLMAQNDGLAKARDLLLPRLMNGEIAV